MEKELDLQLFYRNSRSVALTPAGTVFFKKCPKILDEYRGSVVAARLAQEGYRGSLTLGIMRGHFEPKLPTLYQRFRTAYPHVSLLIRGYSHSSLLSALERGEVDAILNYMPMPSGQESPSILLHKNHQCIITALDHPLASRGSIRMEEVKDEPFVVMARTASIPGHDFIWKTAADAGFAPHVVAEATHVPVLLTLVSCGIGISTLSDDMACLCQGKVAFIPLLGVPFANVRLMWNEDNQNPCPAPPAGRIPVHLLNTAAAPPIRWDRRRCFTWLPIFCGVLPGRFLLQDILHQNRNTPVGVPLQTDADLLGIPPPGRLQHAFKVLRVAAALGEAVGIDIPQQQLLALYGDHIRIQPHDCRSVRKRSPQNG